MNKHKRRQPMPRQTRQPVYIDWRYKDIEVGDKLVINDGPRYSKAEVVKVGVQTVNVVITYHKDLSETAQFSKVDGLRKRNKNSRERIETWRDTIRSPQRLMTWDDLETMEEEDRLEKERREAVRRVKEFNFNMLSMSQLQELETLLKVMEQ